MAKKSRPKPDRAQARRQFLALKPARNPKIDWAEVENRVVLTITPTNNWAMKILTFFLPLSEEERKKRVALDPLGSDVWRLCDGKTTIAQISKSLQDGYKLKAPEAELSLRQFFQTLGKRGYIAFAVEKKVAQ